MEGWVVGGGMVVGRIGNRGVRLATSPGSRPRPSPMISWLEPGVMSQFRRPFDDQAPALVSWSEIVPFFMTPSGVLHGRWRGCGCRRFRGVIGSAGRSCSGDLAGGPVCCGGAGRGPGYGLSDLRGGKMGVAGTRGRP